MAGQGEPNLNNRSNNEGDEIKELRELLTIMQLQPSLAHKFEHNLERALNESSQYFLRMGDISAVFYYCEQIMRVLPNSGSILLSVGKLLLKIGYPMEACGFFQKSLKIDPSDAMAEDCLNRAKNLLVERWHYRMLNDKIRNLAYKKAIQEIITSDDVVLDIGCGSGLLSFYTSEAGASKIIACDSSLPMYKVALDVVKKNNINNITVLNESSRVIDIGKFNGKVSTVITEIFDAGLLGEGALEIILDAWKRLLIPFPKGKIIPMAAKLYMCGVSSDILAKKYKVVYSEYNKLFTHFKFENMNVYRDTLEPYDSENLQFIRDIKYTTNIEKILEIDFGNETELNILNSETGLIKNVNLNILKNEKVDALIMWFDLELCKNVQITTDPKSTERCTAWDVAVFHLQNNYIYKENNSINFNIEWRKGIVKLTENQTVINKNIAISKGLVKFLNDFEYINSIIDSVNFSRIELEKKYVFEDIKILDYTPFPIGGLLMLQKGALKLVCSSTSESLIRELALTNNIDLKKISFIDYAHKLDKNDKYEMIINYFLDPLGHLRQPDIEMAKMFQDKILKRNGISIPHCIKLCVRLTSSNHLDTCNRIYDDNLYLSNKTNQENIKISNFINMYQVTQNSCQSSQEFDKRFLSDEITVYTQCLDLHDSKIIESCITEKGRINCVQAYFKIQFHSEKEELSTDNLLSHINNVYHLIDPPLNVEMDDKVDVMVFSDNCSSVKIILDIDD